MPVSYKLKTTKSIHEINCDAAGTNKINEGCWPPISITMNVASPILVSPARYVKVGGHSFLYTDCFKGNKPSIIKLKCSGELWTE